MSGDAVEKLWASCGQSSDRSNQSFQITGSQAIPSSSPFFPQKMTGFQHGGPLIFPLSHKICYYNCMYKPIPTILCGLNKLRTS